MRQLMTWIAVLLASLLAAASAHAQTADCLAMASAPPRVQLANYAQAALKQDEVSLTFVGHSTFLIESAGGVRIATDYAGYTGGVIPDIATMNRAHSSHYTDFPDAGIKHVLRGWNPGGGAAHHDLQVGDVRIRNVTTDIRGGEWGRVKDGNSIFIFEVAGMCVGHLGHLHHELTPELLRLIGRLDVVLVPVDGSYTMGQTQMLQVLKDLKARLVIPMHYFGPATLARFIDSARTSFAIEFSKEPMLVVSAASLPQEPKLVVLPGY